MVIIESNDIIDLYPEYNAYILKHIFTGQLIEYFTTLETLLVGQTYKEVYIVVGLLENLILKNNICLQIETYENYLK